MKKVLKVMDSSGDTSVAFDSDIKDAAQNDARKLFDDMRSKGAAVFEVGDDSKGSGPIRDFDALGKENVVVPRITGG